MGRRVRCGQHGRWIPRTGALLPQTGDRSLSRLGVCAALSQHLPDLARREVAQGLGDQAAWPSGVGCLLTLLSPKVRTRRCQVPRESGTFSDVLASHRTYFDASINAA